MAKQKKEKYVRICPKCNSTNVAPDSGYIWTIAHGTFSMYRCNDCGFSANSTLFPEVPLSKIQRKDSKVKKEN
jgi:ribosomal protein L37AE/L43A